MESAMHDMQHAKVLNMKSLSMNGVVHTLCGQHTPPWCTEIEMGDGNDRKEPITTGSLHTCGCDLTKTSREKR